MCGILGFINVGNEKTLQECTQLLKFRGPDDEGIEWFDKWDSGFGHRRLSIIDLSSAGHQPMFNSDKSLCIVFNGEIYNYEEINSQLSILNYQIKTKSDTETLLKAYECWGEKCLEKLNGMFAFAIFNTLTGDVFAARDRLGIKPFFYCEVDGGLIFSSGIKAIVESGLVKVKPDYYSLRTQMHFQTGPFTGFEGIYKLKPGHFLKFRVKDNDQLSINNYQLKEKEQENFTTESTEGTEKKINIGKDQKDKSKELSSREKHENKERDSLNEIPAQDHCRDKGMTGGGKKYELEIGKWWDIEAREDDKRSEKELVDELERLLLDAVKLQMVSDVPVGIFLSGGLDSSIIAAMMRKHYKGPINAFTIKFSKDDQKFEKIEDDSFWAKKVADLFEFNYEEIIIKSDVVDLLKKVVYYMDEPLADPAAINTFLISEFARQNKIIVLLNGMGGDEVFGGYRSYKACIIANLYQKLLPGFIRKAIEKIFEKIPVASNTQGFKLIRWAKRFISFASLPEFERFLASNTGINKSEFSEIFNNKLEYEETHYYNTQLGIFNQLKLNHSLKDNTGESNKPRKALSYMTKMCLCDSKIYMTDHNLAYSDKTSMMASVETRPPLIDHRIVEFMFSLPPKYRMKRGIQKYLLKKVAERYLPKEVVYRPKAPFGSPLRSWIRKDLAYLVDELLCEENITKRGLFNYKMVKDKIQNDRKGLEDNAQFIWRLITLELWFQVFFDNL